jgi:hypothetical protein
MQFQNNANSGFGHLHSPTHQGVCRRLFFGIAHVLPFLGSFGWDGLLSDFGGLFRKLSNFGVPLRRKKMGAPGGRAGGGEGLGASFSPLFRGGLDDQRPKAKSQKGRFQMVMHVCMSPSQNWRSSL